MKPNPKMMRKKVWTFRIGKSEVRKSIETVIAWLSVGLCKPDCGGCCRCGSRVTVESLRVFRENIDRMPTFYTVPKPNKKKK